MRWQNVLEMKDKTAAEMIEIYWRGDMPLTANVERITDTVETLRKEMLELLHLDSGYIDGDTRAHNTQLLDEMNRVLDEMRKIAKSEEWHVVFKSPNKYFPLFFSVYESLAEKEKRGEINIGTMTQESRLEILEGCKAAYDKHYEEKCSYVIHRKENIPGFEDYNIGIGDNVTIEYDENGIGKITDITRAKLFDFSESPDDAATEKAKNSPQKGIQPDIFDEKESGQWKN